MSRYNLRISLWAALFAICLFGIIGTGLFSRYDNAIFQSQLATSSALTREAPTATATPVFTPTSTQIPTITPTPTPCTLSLAGITLYEFPSFVNFNGNINSNQGEAIVQFRLKDEPWWFVKISEDSGWILAPQDLARNCTFIPEENLASLQSVQQTQNLFFEDTFEVQFIDWQRSGEFSPRWLSSILRDNNNQIILDALAHGNRLWLASQPRLSDPQIVLSKTNSAREWTVIASFQYAAVGGDNYFGIRLISTKSENSSLELRLYPSPSQCKYEVASYSNSSPGGRVERSGSLASTFCTLGKRFQEPNNSSSLVPYGFLQIDVTQQADRQAIKFAFSFNGSPFSGVELSDPNQMYLDTNLGLVSAEMRSYLDYIVITDR